MRPSSSSAAQQEDGPSTSFQANGDTSQKEAKGKKKGKAPKFERLRVTGTTLMHVAFSEIHIQFDRHCMCFITASCMHTQKEMFGCKPDQLVTRQTAESRTNCNVQLLVYSGLNAVLNKHVHKRTRQQ